MRRLVRIPQQVTENVRQYNQDLPQYPELKARLPNHSDWYYSQSERQFGPSKFIGYIGMTGYRYTNPNEEDGSYNGGQTEKALASMSVVPTTSEGARLTALLMGFLAGYCKNLKSGFKLRVLIQ